MVVARAKRGEGIDQAQIDLLPVPIKSQVFRAVICVLACSPPAAIRALQVLIIVAMSSHVVSMTYGATRKVFQHNPSLELVGSNLQRRRWQAM